MDFVVLFVFLFFLSKSATREGKPPINRFGTLKIKREKTQKIRKDDDASEMRTTQNDRARSARKTIRQRPKAKKKKRTNERKKEGKKESRRNETTAAAAAAACGNATEAGRSNGGRCCRAGSAALPLVGASTLANGHQGYLLFPAHRFCDLNPATSPLYGKVFTEFFFFRSFSFVRSSSKSRRWPLCDFLFFLFCFVFCFFFGLGEFYSDASSFPLSVPRQVLYGEFVTEFYRVSIRPLPCWQWVDTAELFTRFHQFFVFNRATTHSIFRRLPTCSFFFGLELLAMTSPRFFFLPSCTEFFFSLPFD